MDEMAALVALATSPSESEAYQMLLARAHRKTGAVPPRKGTLVQYAGRLHRLHPRKTEVRIYDYVDREVRSFYGCSRDDFAATARSATHASR